MEIFSNTESSSTSKMPLLDTQWQKIRGKIIQNTLIQNTLRSYDFLSFFGKCQYESTSNSPITI